MSYNPIGVFDSGYGGLTVLRSIVNKLPQYDYLYLGDNARAPYGPRSFETVYHYTLESVRYFFKQGCKLVVLACNTASAKALRTIQQNDLANIDPSLRVLGVIRPTTEMIGSISKTKHVGILGTKGTVTSQSYPIEIEKFYPDVKVTQHACPMWVPLVENDEYNGGGVDYFVKKDLDILLQEDPHGGVGHPGGESENGEQRRQPPAVIAQGAGCDLGPIPAQRSYAHRRPVPPLRWRLPRCGVSSAGPVGQFVTSLARVR